MRFVRPQDSPDASLDVGRGFAGENRILAAPAMVLPPEPVPGAKVLPEMVDWLMAMIEMLA